MARISLNDLYSLTEEISRLTGDSWELQTNNPGDGRIYRVTRNGHYVGPRAKTASQIADFLDAFKDGMREGLKQGMFAGLNAAYAETVTKDEFKQGVKASDIRENIGNLIKQFKNS